MHREGYEMEKSEKACKNNAAKKDPAEPGYPASVHLRHRQANRR